MSLKHAILGFLSVEEMNGYQLKKHFDESISRFWSVSISQIYPTLNDMLKTDLITVREDDNSSRGSKQYSITEKGKEELKQWLATPTTQELFRSELLVKLYFSANIDEEIVMQQLLEKKEEAQKRMAFYDCYLKHIEEEHQSKNQFSKDAVYWKMTVRYGMFQSGSFINWCDECIETLKKFKKESSKYKK